jgi:hypothetical protein
MTNYECYFGNYERTFDSLSMLLEFPNHPRAEVRSLQKEVRDMGVKRWLSAECTNQRWWLGIPLKKEGEQPWTLNHA